MLDFLSNGIVIAGAVILFALIVLVWYVTRLIITVKPNEAVIRAGKGADGKQAIYTQGLVLAVPIIHQIHTLSLEQREATLTVNGGVDSNFIPISVEANLQFKFGEEELDIRRAAQRFLGFSAEKIQTVIQKSVEGSLRGVVSKMSAEEANIDRDKLGALILEAVEAPLLSQGIKIDALNISKVSTPDQTVIGADGKQHTINYLDEIGKPKLEQAQQVARVAASKARQAADEARIAQEEATAARDRDLAIKKSQFKAEEDREAAIAGSAHELAKAEQDVKVAELERKALAEKALVEQERLDIEVHKPADAAAYKTRVDAEARRAAAVSNAEADAQSRVIQAEASKKAAIANAEANAETTRVEAEGQKKAKIAQAEAQASSVTLTTQAEADAVRAKGEAEAASIEAIGRAQAAAENAQAEALNHHTDASLQYLAIAALPEIVRSSAAAVAGIDNYTVISTDGASDAVKQGNRIITEAGGLAGVDIKAILNGLAGGALAGFGNASDAPVSPPTPVIESSQNS